MRRGGLQSGACPRPTRCNKRHSCGTTAIEKIRTCSMGIVACITKQVQINPMRRAIRVRSGDLHHDRPNDIESKSGVNNGYFNRGDVRAIFDGTQGARSDRDDWGLGFDNDAPYNAVG